MSDTVEKPSGEKPAPSVKVNDRRRVRDDVDAVGTEPGQPAPSASASPAAPATEAPAGEAQRLHAELDAARKRVDELARGLQHSEAEREAFKQRLTRERDQLLDLEKGKVAMVLLESLDDLELCLSAPDGSPLYQGVRLIRDGLVRKAIDFGLERVELLGTTYDPNLAEASDMEVCATEADDMKVVAVSKAAWRLKGRVLRPGRVKVLRFVKPAEA
ncbi:MAG: nucleotide exchange factor GrpE [Myxococcaceae bacterium]|jgi:molecular chaperone GrpE|nr:nucleotide exchange factor GrpE [Myxococcaceae bacterium]MCA3016924.1 nucleotide exchange factor GrpE [Myxococcaceae bacterium]